jgi:hypothetical protein
MVNSDLLTLHPNAPKTRRVGDPMQNCFCPDYPITRFRNYPIFD